MLIFKYLLESPYLEKDQLPGPTFFVLATRPFIISLSVTLRRSRESRGSLVFPLLAIRMLWAMRLCSATWFWLNHVMTSGREAIIGRMRFGVALWTLK